MKLDIANMTVAEKYLALADKNPDRIPQYITSLRDYYCSQTLQRNFGETNEDFLTRCPKVKQRLDNVLSAIDVLCDKSSL